MRVHLLALPNVQTTTAYSLDGFAMMTIRFARLLKRLGHTVYLYASDENEAPCDELVPCITKEEIETLLAATRRADGVFEATPYQYAYIDERSPLFQLHNARAIRAIGTRKQSGDLLCTIGGVSQKIVADAHPDLVCVEYSVGYEGSFSSYRVFESVSHRHWTYGWQAMKEGCLTDTVIPAFVEPDECPFQAIKEPFVLYAGRLTERKGVEIACRAASAAGVPLRAIGHGNPALVTHGAEYLGALSRPEMLQWMARAQAVLCPTTYIEPFNCVAVEAQLCGTPVIATDYGGFTDTVVHGVSGFRCSTLEDFTAAIPATRALDPVTIRARAESLYSLEAVAPQYQRYFDRIVPRDPGDVIARSHPTQEGDVVLTR